MIPPLAHVGRGAAHGNFEGLEQGMKAPVTMLDGGDFDGAKAYKDSKVCDVMLMKELHRDATCGVLHQCLWLVGEQRNIIAYPLQVFQNLFPAFHKTVTKAQGLAACVADDRYATSGSYYSWEGEAGTGGGGGREAVSNTEKVPLPRGWVKQPVELRC
eukprot:Skav209084  [mRNA]  locus=scaffold207:572241:579778:- [translate_table: standard]